MFFDYNMWNIELFAHNSRTDEFAQFSLRSFIVYANKFTLFLSYSAFFSLSGLYAFTKLLLPTPLSKV